MNTIIKLSKGPFIVSSIAILIIGIVAWILKYSNLWGSVPLQDGVDVFFCEFARMDHAIRQPMNTWTNIPYLFIGVLLLKRAKYDCKTQSRDNLMINYPIYTFLFGIGCLYLFTGSTLFHASLSTWAQQWDMSAVYALALLPTFYNIHKIFNLYYFKHTHKTNLRSLFTILGIFVVTVAILTSLKWYLDAFIVIPVLLGLLLASSIYLEYKLPPRTNRNWVILATIAISLGIACYALDVKKVFCNEYGFLQPHAIWHLFAAAAILMCYLYMRSENKERYVG